MLDPADLANDVVIADGAWSTQLHERGFARMLPAESANVTRPDLVGTLAREYVRAGARIVTTNTFAANRFAAERRGIKEDLREINGHGAQLAREACSDSGATVGGAIGPSGLIVAVQEVDEAELLEAFSQQASALAEGGAQWIVLETFSELAELVIAIKAVKQAAPCPVVASMSFDAGPQRTRTVMGAAASEVAGQLEDAGADVIGSNCGAGIAYALPAVVALKANSSLPIWVRPSAGLPDLEDGVAVFRNKPEEIDEFIGHLLDAGANVIGGCCGMGPAHIKRIAALTGAWKKRRAG
jgi:methionine synthase I (cobalamin-dependent)